MFCRRTILSASVEDVGSNILLVRSSQRSFSTPNESFVLGESGGDVSNTSSGSLTGTLLTGRTYRFGYGAELGFSYDPSPSELAVASGFVTLTLVPEPSTASLAGLGMLALAAIGRCRRR